VTIWFVELREFTLRIRRRTSDEIGNWRGILKEVRGDLRAENVLPEGRETTIETLFLGRTVYNIVT
jgi:hypothetical protein